MRQEEFTPRSNANLRRIELTLISSLNQLDIQLQRLSETQEQLILTTDYLQQTSAPLIVLSSIGFTDRYLERQRTEISAATDAIREVIRILRELQFRSNLLAPTAATVAAATSSSLIDTATSSAPRSFVRNSEILFIPTVELVPRTVLLEGEEVQEANKPATEQVLSKKHRNRGERLSRG
jgi:hypothetical protein